MNSSWDCSWDYECEVEFETWIKDPNKLTVAELNEVGNLFAILKEGLEVDGPEDRSQCQSVTRVDGNEVAVHCYVRRRTLVMCVGFCRKTRQMRVVIFGKCKPSEVWRKAKHRITRWN